MYQYDVLVETELNLINTLQTFSAEIGLFNHATVVFSKSITNNRNRICVIINSSVK